METITISKALKRRKELKSKLSRLTELETDNFEVVIPITYKNVRDALSKIPDELNFMSFDAYEKEIAKITGELTVLRNAIDKISHGVTAEFDGKKYSLAMIRIMVENERADIDRLQKLKHGKRFAYKDRENRLKSDDMEKSVQQISDQELEDIIEARKSRKTDLEAVLEKLNVQTEITI